MRMGGSFAAASSCLNCLLTLQGSRAVPIGVVKTKLCSCQRAPGAEPRLQLTSPVAAQSLDGHGGERNSPSAPTGLGLHELHSRLHGRQPCANITQVGSQGFALLKRRLLPQRPEDRPPLRQQGATS